MAGLTCLFKLQCIAGPPMLMNIVPQKELPLAFRPRTRSQIQAASQDHGCRLQQSAKPTQRGYLLRSFPNVLVPVWNRLPRDVLSDGIKLEGMQKFKLMVHVWMLNDKRRSTHDLIAEAVASCRD